MSPFDYVQRVTKMKLDDNSVESLQEGLSPMELATDLPDNYLLFSDDHPQHTTHVQVIRDCSNSKKPLPIPVLLGFALPRESIDPLKYHTMVMSLLSPYQHPSDLLLDKSGNELCWADGYKCYMSHLKNNDVVTYKMLKRRLSNMRATTEGREQQKLDKMERERLRMEQGLLEDPVENLPGYDFNSNDSDYDTPTTFPDSFDEIIPLLPSVGPFEKHVDKYEDELTVITSDKKDHTSTSGNQQSHYNVQSEDKGDSPRAQISRFEGLLKKAKEQLYTSDDPGNSTSDDTLGTTDVDTIMNKHGLDVDQRNGFLTISHHVM